MKTVTTFSLILAGGLALAPDRAEACDPTPLPVPHCNVDTTCCIEGVWQDQPDDNLCDEAMLFDLLAPQCPADYGAHFLTYNMDTDSFDGHGLGQCQGDLEFTKHWLATLVARGGIDWWEPNKRHAESDWAQVIQAQATSFHVLQEHSLCLDTSAIGQNTSWPIPDAIEFGCKAFDAERSGGELAGVMVHESWHSTVGGHAIDHEIGHDRDYFYAHDRQDAQPLWLYYEVPDGLWPEKDEEAYPVRHSVYQLEYEFLCELVESPANWMPRSVLFEAAAEAADNLAENFIQHPVPVPAWAMCDEPAPLDSSQYPGLPHRARTVAIRIGGHYYETSVASIDDDEGDFEHITDLVTLDALNPTHDFPRIEIVNGADGEIQVEFEGKLQLAADGETITFSYNLLFYENDGDGPDCDEDVGGADCPAKGDPAQWNSVVLDSTNPPTTQFLSLSNHVSEDGCDYVNLEVDFAGSW